MLIHRPVIVLAGLVVVSAAYLQAAEPPSAGASCDPVPGLTADLLVPGTVLVLGEIHGTTQAPAFAADVACAAARAGRKVLVGLEVPREEAARIEAFVASAGGAADREALVAGPFWRREYQDGRSSQAMAALLDALRGLRAAGHAVSAAAFDRAERTSAQERDRAMAAELARALGADSTAVGVVLTGNLHARLRIGTPWNATFENMGYLLGQALPERRLVALDGTSTGGSAWICQSGEAASCGAKTLGGGPGTAPGITAGATLDDKGYHGTYFLGELVASPPAVAPGG